MSTLKQFPYITAKRGPKIFDVNASFIFLIGYPASISEMIHRALKDLFVNQYVYVERNYLAWS